MYGRELYNRDKAGRTILVHTACIWAFVSIHELHIMTFTAGFLTRCARVEASMSLGSGRPAGFLIKASAEGDLILFSGMRRCVACDYDFVAQQS